MVKYIYIVLNTKDGMIAAYESRIEAAKAKERLEMGGDKWEIKAVAMYEAK